MAKIYLESSNFTYEKNIYPNTHFSTIKIQIIFTS